MLTRMIATLPQTIPFPPLTSKMPFMDKGIESKPGTVSKPSKSGPLDGSGLCDFTLIG